MLLCLLTCLLNILFIFLNSGIACQINIHSRSKTPRLNSGIPLLVINRTKPIHHQTEVQFFVGRLKCAVLCPFGFVDTHALKYVELCPSGFLETQKSSLTLP